MNTLLYKSVLGLSNIKRFPTYRLNNEYNCAEHSYRVAMIAMILVDEYNLNPANLKKIDKAEVLTKALIHDIEEAKINDIPSPIKKYPGLRDLLREASEEIIRTDILDSSLPNRLYYLKMWREDKEDDSGEIIELADKMEAFIATKIEVAKGNIEFQNPYENLKSWMESKEGIRLIEKYPYSKKLME